MPSRKLRRWLLVVTVGIVGLVLARVYQTRHWPSTELPPLEAATLTGKAVSLPDERPVILHFWATWCGVCKAEQPSIEALSQDARIVTVASFSGSQADVQRYVDEHRLGFDVIHDPNGELAGKYGVGVYPTTFFVEADGEILAREVGYVTPWGLRARWWLTQ